eukprot:m51a1_g14178 hypothetical protein (366) ;mRNA; r:49396-50493
MLSDSPGAAGSAAEPQNAAAQVPPGSPALRPAEAPAEAPPQTQQPQGEGQAAALTSEQQQLYLQWVRQQQLLWLQYVQQQQRSQRHSQQQQGQRLSQTRLRSLSMPSYSLPRASTSPVRVPSPLWVAWTAQQGSNAQMVPPLSLVSKSACGANVPIEADDCCTFVPADDEPAHQHQQQLLQHLPQALEQQLGAARPPSPKLAAHQNSSSPQLVVRRPSSPPGTSTSPPLPGAREQHRDEQQQQQRQGGASTSPQPAIRRMVTPPTVLIPSSSSSSLGSVSPPPVRASASPKGACSPSASPRMVPTSPEASKRARGGLIVRGPEDEAFAGHAEGVLPPLPPIPTPATTVVVHAMPGVHSAVHQAQQ